MYKEEIVIPFMAIVFVCITFLIVPKLAWVFLALKLALLIYLKYKNKKQFLCFKFKHLDQTIRYIISILIIYFLNILIFSNFVGEKLLWYYTATILIYIASTTTLTTRFGEKLEEKCILCHKYKILNYISFPIFILNISLVIAMYFTVLYDAVEKYGLLIAIVSSLILSPIITLCWMFRKKVDPKLSIPWVLFAVLTIIHYYVFTTGVF